ncbi:MAG: hypothetical protein AB7I18_05460 [Candidatus Berkiella sp.]
MSGDPRVIREQLIQALRDIINSEALKTELHDSLEGDILGIKLKGIMNDLIENHLEGTSDPNKLITAIRALEEHSLIKNNKLTRFKTTLHNTVNQYAATLTSVNSVPISFSNQFQQWPIQWGTIGNYFEIRSLPLKPTAAQIQRHRELTELQKAEKRRLMHLRAAFGEAGREELMHGVDLDKAVSPTSARMEYLNYLGKRMHEIKQVPTNSQHISMDEMLGSKGKELYLAALKEESNTREFREAVLLACTKHFPGKAWDKPKIIIGAGSTGAGKSYARDQVVASVSEEKEDPSHPGNDVVSIDGGVERETSQMRMLTLQVALARGYDGIDDLQKVSEDIGIRVKRHVKNAVLAANKANKDHHSTHFSLYVPVTFANPFEKAHHLLSEEGYDPLFVLVNTDETQNKIMLRDRAFRTDPIPFLETELRLGGIIDKVDPKCESKEPKPGNVSRGNEKSQDQMKSAHRKGVACQIADNDLVQLKRVSFGWEICSDYKKDKVDLKMLRRDFEKWNAQDPQFKMDNPLELWSKLSANRSAYQIVAYRGGPIEDYLLFPKKPKAKEARTATLAKSMSAIPTVKTPDPRLTKSDDSDTIMNPEFMKEIRQNPLFVRSATAANMKARTTPKIEKSGSNETKPDPNKKLSK